MSGWAVAFMSGARQLAGYALLLPFLLGTLITSLLLTNLLISYWFQQRVQKTRMPPRASLKQRPPVAPIPRLSFARQLPRTLATSLVPSEYTAESWQPPANLTSYPALSSEVHLLLSLVLRDFVDAWFGELSADPSFPRSVRVQISQALECLAERAVTVDLAEVLVGGWLPLVTRQLRGARTGDAVAWHPAMGPEGAVELRRVRAHVRRVIDLVVPLVLAPAQASFAPHRVLVREILTGALLTPVVMSLADPDTLNQLVDGQLAKLIREQHMVSELRGALDQQAAQEVEEEAEQEEGVQTYEQFMQSIDGCADAGQLDLITEDIVAQIRKRRILIMGQGAQDIVHGQRVADIIVYINRLYVAKRKAERRRQELVRRRTPRGQQQQQQQQLSRASTYYAQRDDPLTLGPPQFTLREILTNVWSLSAFAEHMEQQGRQMLLEFWVNVEGVRTARATQAGVVASLWKTYFTLRVDELAADDLVEGAISRVQRCLKPLRLEGSLDLDTGRLTPELCSEALARIFAVQEAVFEHIARALFPGFLASPLYSRVLREYYVTPRQEHREARLFSAEPLAEQEEDEGPPAAEPMVPQKPARRMSLVRSVTGSLTRRTASTASSEGSIATAPRRWNLSLRAPAADAPLVSMTAATAESSMAVPADELPGQQPEPRKRERSIACLTEALADATPVAPRSPAASVHSLPLAAEPPALTRRRSVRVGRSEVRRLSASLRSIALGSEPTDMALQMTPMNDLDSHSEGPVDSGEDHVDSEGEEPVDSLSESEDVESLVLARVLSPAAPGDLFVDERLARVSHETTRKTHQMAIVRALMRQAQTRHRPNEQRVLRASYLSLRREVRESHEQARIYRATLSDHDLLGKRVHIPRAVTETPTASAAAPTGQNEPFVRYLIEVHQSLPPQYASVHAPAGWVVGRRYREFFAMHRELRSEMPEEMKGHELPARTPLGRLLGARDVDVRRRALEKYLQGLVRHPKLCRARALRLFLSSAAPPPALSSPLAADGGEAGHVGEPPGDGWIERIQKTVGEDIGQVTGAESMLELIVQELGAHVAMQQPLPPAGAFVDPLSDLFVECFGLQSRRNWLRRQAISVLLRHIFGGTVERRIRDLLTTMTASEQLARHLEGLRVSLWPEVAGRPGVHAKFKGFGKRSEEEMRETKRSAREQFLMYVPRALGAMVGKRNAREGAQRLFDAVQSPAHNLNLVLHLFDAVVAAAFPEVRFQMDWRPAEAS
ncbi:tRNA (guanine-N(7)-)-methyltransferase (tRNA(m7G46)-methyltransferase) [Coemansia interrupta]|uniref:tRNA (Guanine-N(7)-)-methyltransferase (tRNA(m7G46)-methyltransferase) n=1 Tax=Coemansia interrupta TaxID=1126814 RepID=A0A9W8LL76_9FUNG|nr:tRNA (guanine-N(7)-)-methyltransferase (tRNA(m7G46)-methyltransferase) [Coemansia interrupta]